MKKLKAAVWLIAAGLAAAPLAAPLAQSVANTAAINGVSGIAVVSTSPSVSETLRVIYQTVESSPEQSSSGQAVYGQADFKVLITSTGEVKTLSPKDYLRGAVAAEMPPEYGDEAIKAQIVAAHTYAVSYKIRESGSPDPALNGADISDDPSAGQAYVGDEEILRLYTDGAAYIERLNDLIDKVGDYIMLYEGEPIVAAYHAISCGKTESAQNIWGAYSPYLVAVNSNADSDSPDYLSKVMLARDEVYSRLTAAGAKPGNSADSWFSSVLKTPSGYVSAAKVGNTAFTGAQLREMFGLRSTCFDVTYNGGIFTFTVKGWGHGVGMSKYGAGALAEQGLSFDRILKTYYTGVTFCEL